jgi:hypothetical protein
VLAAGAADAVPGVAGAAGEAEGGKVTVHQFYGSRKKERKMEKFQPTQAAQVISLRSMEPAPATSRIAGAAQEWKYTLLDGRVWYVKAPHITKVNALGVAAGVPFRVFLREYAPGKNVLDMAVIPVSPAGMPVPRRPAERPAAAGQLPHPQRPMSEPAAARPQNNTPVPIRPEPASWLTDADDPGQGKARSQESEARSQNPPPTKVQYGDAFAQFLILARDAVLQDGLVKGSGSAFGSADAMATAITKLATSMFIAADRSGWLTWTPIARKPVERAAMPVNGHANGHAADHGARA